MIEIYARDATGYWIGINGDVKIVFENCSDTALK